ncbi:imidazole glycerol phosphate synthase subunit HisH [Ponticaulis profundi]|uniref:Imidazole glycerol phosphate synthase subunit HisH n=1 Tax=Ponticaulis profundi TaxID=2665222 RepID=A0ABW1S903_9PROT
MPTIVLIDYGAGNIPSVERALEVALRDTGLSFDVQVTDRPEHVLAADRIVIPGVGHFRDCRDGLFKPDGMIDALNEACRTKARPTLGICVGMQLMADIGLEDGKTEGLGWIPGKVDAIPTSAGLPIPHMGWNELIVHSNHPVLDGIEDGDHAYFVHSYHYRPESSSDLLLTTDYGGTITAAIGRDTLVGSQFHPEISQATGLRLLKNWISWNP